MQFILEEVGLKGCYSLAPKVLGDTRGQLVKTFHEGVFKKHNLEVNFKEEYFSVSKKNVLRGMHFQLPPYAHTKLVYCISGAVLDVLLDLRRESSTYGHAVGVDLSEAKRNIIYIPPGVAHGFYTLTETAVMVYKTSTVYEGSADSGVLWSSFKFEWPTREPILSERDQKLTAFVNFNSPF